MTISIVNKATINACREKLGAGCSMPEVAEALGVSIPTIRRRLSLPEIHEWSEAYRRNRRDSYLDRAIRKLRVKKLALGGRLPTARESGIHTSVMTRCGGYNAIVTAAGYTPKWVRRQVA